MSITTSDLLTRFGQSSPDIPVERNAKLAAIALIFWQSERGLKLCLGRRAINPADPWSGDMAFPGGRAEVWDSSVHAVASRETEEEVGLRLPPDSLIGRMAQLHASGGRDEMRTGVWPLVYLLESRPAPFRLGGEMSEAHWVPVEHLWDRQNWMAFSFPPTRAQRAGITVGHHFLWGFSLHVLITLSEELGCSLQPIRVLEDVVHIDQAPA